MILTVTLNASIDKAYTVAGAIKEGSVSRVKACHNTAGGKGLNVSRVVKQCGNKVMATGLVGGYNGEYLCTLLTNDGIVHDFVKVANETRSCINILNETTLLSTEFLEPGCEVSNVEIEAFIKHYQKLLPTCKVVTLSGSIPKGIIESIYNTLITLAKEANKKVILDTSGKLLLEGVKACPTMIKPNQEELEAILNYKITSQQMLLEKAISLQQSGIEYVVISLGKKGAMVVAKQGVFKAKPPNIKAINTVGCGDSMVAAFAVAFEKEYSIEQALQYAVAVSASNALTMETGNINRKDVTAMLDQIKVEKIR